MGNTNYVSKKNKQFTCLFGNSLRSKIVAILLENKEIRSSDINKRVNLFGEEYKLSIIQEHISDMKRNGFVNSRRDGKQIFLKINSSGNVFLRNFCELMKAPKANKHNPEKKIRKSTEEWISEIYSAIVSVTKNKTGERFTSAQLRKIVDIDSQRLFQILTEMIGREMIGSVEDKRGLYFVKVILD